MDEEKKKQINNAIAVLRDMCIKHSCSNCPFYPYNCEGPGYYCDFPSNWADVE